MNYAPERIWATPEDGYCTATDIGGDKRHALGFVEYVRADLIPQWQPIETAPRDGTKIVIARHGWSSFPVAAWMDYPGNPVIDDDGNDIWVAGWGHDCLGFSYGYEDYWLGFKDDPMPTHWMPLPEPPK